MIMLFRSFMAGGGSGEAEFIFKGFNVMLL
jgi:hypothetical protein